MAGALVIGPLGLGHHLQDAAFVARRQRQRFLGLLDRLVAGQQAAEHAAHLVGQFDVEPGQVLVDAHQPALEAGEGILQVDARRLAFGQVLLEAAGELLVLLDGQRRIALGA
ncbi:hypothetical protein D9M68_495100 [compost metagenome]